MEKSIGFIGVGNIGGALARHCAGAGYTVILSNSRGKASLTELAKAIGANARAADTREALTAEIIVLSVPWSKLEATLQDPTAWNDKIVIDTTNNILATSPTLQLADLDGRTTGEKVAELLPTAQIVKAFNTLYYKILEQSPLEGGGNRVIVMSGDDAQAKTKVADLITSIGFVPVNLGGLKFGCRLQDIGGPFSSLNLVKVR